MFACNGTESDKEKTAAAAEVRKADRKYGPSLREPASLFTQPRRHLFEQLGPLQGVLCDASIVKP